MAEKEPLSDRRRALEEDYFRKQDQELIERLRRQADMQRGRDSMARTIGIDDEQLLQELEQRGFTAATASLLPLMPLLEVAWAEGNISEAERKMIIGYARLHGIAPDSQADRQLTDWLEMNPGRDVFDSALRVTRAMMAALPPDQRKLRHDSLLSYCTSLAQASGGIFGFGAIKKEEEEALRRVADALEAKHGAAAKAVID